MPSEYQIDRFKTPEHFISQMNPVPKARGRIWEEPTVKYTFVRIPLNGGTAATPAPKKRLPKQPSTDKSTSQSQRKKTDPSVVDRDIKIKAMLAQSQRVAHSELVTKSQQGFPSPNGNLPMSPGSGAADFSASSNVLSPGALSHNLAHARNQHTMQQLNTYQYQSYQNQLAQLQNPMYTPAQRQNIIERTQQMQAEMMRMGILQQTNGNEIPEGSMDLEMG